MTVGALNLGFSTPGSWFYQTIFPTNWSLDEIHSLRNSFIRAENCDLRTPDGMDNSTIFLKSEHSQSIIISLLFLKVNFSNEFQSTSSELRMISCGRMAGEFPTRK